MNCIITLAICYLRARKAGLLKVSPEYVLCPRDRYIMSTMESCTDFYRVSNFDG